MLLSAPKLQTLALMKAESKLRRIMGGRIFTKQQSLLNRAKESLSKAHFQLNEDLRKNIDRAKNAFKQLEN